MSGVPFELAPTQVEMMARTLRSSGFRILARVPATNHATDLAVALNSTRLAVVRCTAHAGPADHSALTTMISQGDFIWGAIVCSESAENGPFGLIESFHTDLVDQLVARLVALREACHEAG
jgi:hypothetical protein